MASYVIALTGASGAVYGIRLVDELLARGDDVDLVISPSGFLLLEEELGISPARKNAAHGVMAHIQKNRGERKGRRLITPEKGRKKKEGTLKSFPFDDLTACFASGSARKKAMIICPCSMGTLGRIANGISGNLIERAADCVLKERGRLILVPRETPLSSIHLENMLRLSNAGAVILPAMPGFYSSPSTIGDMVDFIVGKILDMLGEGNSLYKRWKKD